MEENKFYLILSIVAVIGILLFTSLIVFSIHINYKIKIANFENTINDLTDEQKCLHICGFRFDGSSYFENYKYCVEKCDRISERSLKGCTE